MICKTMTLISLNIGLYLLATLFLIGTLLRKGPKYCWPLGCITIIAGLILQAYNLSFQLTLGNFDEISAFEALSLASLIMVLLVLPYLKRHLNTAIIITLFAAVTQALSLFDTNDVSFGTPSAWLSIHILTSIVAYAILLLASIQAFLVYLRDRSLKQKRSIAHRLPPIMRMEHLLFQLLLIGFIMLTISLLTSLAFFDQWFTAHFIHKTILTGFAWLLYGAILFARYKFGLRGQAAAKYILITAVILLLGITGTRLIQEFLFTPETMVEISVLPNIIQSTN